MTEKTEKKTRGVEIGQKHHCLRRSKTAGAQHSQAKKSHQCVCRLRPNDRKGGQTSYVQEAPQTWKMRRYMRVRQ